MKREIGLSVIKRSSWNSNVANINCTHTETFWTMMNQFPSPFRWEKWKIKVRWVNTNILVL